MEQKFIILDRDGVINKDREEYITAPDEWEPIPGSLEAISLLAHSSFTVLVATNQSGIGRGYYDEYTLARTHEKMQRLVEQHGGRISGVFYCPHTPEEHCRCRKPRTGMLEQMEAEFGLNLSGVPFVGDSEKDLDCALAMGCRPVLVRTGNGTDTWQALSPDKREKVAIFDDLFSAAMALTRAGDRHKAGPGHG